MFDTFRQSPRHAVIIFGLVFIISLSYALVIVDKTQDVNDGNIGALLDDTWIHARFADHISRGEGLKYNDEITFGATSPFWVLGLAASYTIFQPDIFGQIDIAIIHSIIGYILTVLAITGFGWWITKQAWIGLGAGIMTAVTARFLWMGLSGMEITTFTAFMIFAIWSHIYDWQEKLPFGWRTGIICAFATLARPEAYLLSGLIGLDAVIVQPLLNPTDKTQSSTQRIINQFIQSWRGIVSYLIIAGSYPFYSLIQSGHPLPNTFRAKSQFGDTLPDLPHDFFWAANNEHGNIIIGLAIIGFVFALWQFFKNREASALWIIWAPIFVLAVLLLTEDAYIINNSRYVAPSIPFHSLLAMIGIWALIKAGQRVIEEKYIRPIAYASIAIVGIFIFNRGYEDLSNNLPHSVKQIYQMHVQTGYWLEARTEPNDIIALNDVGAIVHVSDRQVLDLEGLVSPEVIEAEGDTERFTCPHDLQLARLMLEQQPKFLAIFTWFYPCLSSWNKAIQPQAVFEITGPTVIASGEMIIFSPVWENWPMQSSLPQDNALTPTQAIYQHGIELVAYQTQLEGNQLEVELWWHATQEIPEDYQVFVHMINRNDELTILAQHDGPPQDQGQVGQYWQFVTSWWRAGDYIRDRHTLQIDDLNLLEDENVVLAVGMYRLGDFARLPRIDNDPNSIDKILLPINLPLPDVFGS